MKDWMPRAVLGFVTLVILAIVTDSYMPWHRRVIVPPIDTFQVTSPYIDSFMLAVEYPDSDYTFTRVTDFPGGGPGDADISPFIRLSWEADSAAVLRVCEPTWSWDYAIPRDSSAFDLYNMVPGREYSYFVLSERGDTLAQGRFYAKGTLHQAFLRSGVRNCRDLGGWKTIDGHTVAFRKLYRGGRLVGDYGDSFYLSAEGRQDAFAAGIRAELDLRDEETKSEVSAFGPGVTFCAPGFEAGGTVMLGDHQYGVARSFKFIVKSLRDGRGVFFHCSMGRDRTGTMAAILLGVLGVSEGDISKEYELTYFAPRGYSWYPGQDGGFFYTRVNGIQNTCRYIKKHHGPGTFQECTERYLLSVGVSQEEIDDFKILMLE